MADSLKKLDPSKESIVLSPGKDKNLIARCLFSSVTCGEFSTKLVLLLVLGNSFQFWKNKDWSMRSSWLLTNQTFGGENFKTGLAVVDVEFIGIFVLNQLQADLFDVLQSNSKQSLKAS